MCQSKAAGGKRCASHNNDKEHRRWRREADAARRAYGNADEIEAAEQLEILARLTDPKNGTANRDHMLALLPAETRAAALPVADAAIQHQRAAAKAAGNAQTEKMFDRTAEATAFDAEADEERSRAAKLVNGLHAALVTARYAVSERIGDVLEGDERPATAVTAAAAADKTAGEHGVFRSWLIDVLEATDAAIAETAEGIGAGVGITAPTVALAASSKAATKAEPAGGGDAATDDVIESAETSTADDSGNDGDADDHGGDDYEPDEVDDPEHQDDAAAADEHLDAAPDESSDGDGPGVHSPDQDRRRETEVAVKTSYTTTPTTDAAAAEPVTTKAGHDDGHQPPKRRRSAVGAGGEGVRGRDSDKAHAGEVKVGTMYTDPDVVGEQRIAGIGALPDLSTLTDAELLALIEKLERARAR